jgi:uncharacterized protein YbjT (DUF2867 family)
MILVTGATGTVGSIVVRLLRERDEPLRVMTRNPPGHGPDAVFGDFTDAGSLAAAARTASAVFLLSASGARLPAHDLAMIRAAVAAGVGRMVKLSAIGTPDEPGTGLGSWHQPGEQAVRTSGVPWTILRPTTFASNTLSWREAIRAGEPIENMYGDGRQGIVDPADVAAVAVAALTGPSHEGRTYTLTGPDLLSAPDQVRILGDTLGRSLFTVDLPIAAARERMLAAGVPASFVEVAVEGAALVRRNGNAVVTDDVSTVLGRPARDFAAWAREHAEAFQH